jgi:hypothetical protein
VLAPVLGPQTDGHAASSTNPRRARSGGAARSTGDLSENPPPPHVH